MKVKYLFEEFLEEKYEGNYGITKKGKLYIVNEMGKETVATNHIYITDIDIEEYNASKIIFYVKYHISDAVYRNSVQDTYVTRLSNKRISCDWKEIIDNMQFENTGYRREITKLYQEYFKIVIEEFISANPGIFVKCGWIQNEGKYSYRPLNDDTIQDAGILKDYMFNGILRKEDWKNSIEDFCADNENFKEIFSLILDSETALTVFAYSLHAVLWNGIYGYYPWKEKIFVNSEPVNFSLCLCGKETSIANALANVLANVFDVKNNQWSVISRKYHLSATSLSEDDWEKIIHYRSVPILVTSKSNRFTRNSGTVKKFHSNRKKGEWFVFPVYIGITPIIADEIINCNVDSVRLSSLVKEKRLMSTIHEQFLMLLIKLIQYYAEVASRDHLDREPYEHFTNLTDVINSYALSDEWLDGHIPQLLLFCIMDAFCYYLEGTPLRVWVADLRQKMEQTFLKGDAKVKAEAVAGTTAGVTEASINADEYLIRLNSFIHDTLEADKAVEWLFTGNEQRGEKEVCYYLLAEIGYGEFVKVLIKEQVPPIKKHDFNNLLRLSGVLKLPKTGSSNTLQRKGKSYYVIKKEALEKWMKSHSEQSCPCTCVKQKVPFCQASCASHSHS